MIDVKTRNAGEGELFVARLSSESGPPMDASFDLGDAHAVGRAQRSQIGVCPAVAPELFVALRVEADPGKPAGRSGLNALLDARMAETEMGQHEVIRA